MSGVNTGVQNVYKPTQHTTLVVPQFLPPFFKDFGKSLRDLHDKDYKLDHTVEVKTNTPNGVEFTTNCSSGTKGLLAKIIAKYTASSFIAQAEADTGGKIKAELTFDRLGVDGLKVVLTGTEVPSGKAAVEYKMEHLAVNGAATMDDGKAVLEGALALGHDGISIGGGATFDTKEEALVDYNAGAQYEADSYTCTLKTTSKAENLQAGYFHRARPGTLVGGYFEYNLDTDAKNLLLAVDHTLKPGSRVKAKLHSSGLATAMYSERVNPNFRLQFTTQFDVTDMSRDKHQLGIGMFFGDN